MEYMKKWKIFFIGIIFMFGVGGCKSGAQNSPVGDNENKHMANNVHEEEKIYPVTDELTGVVKAGTLSHSELTILLTNRNKYDYYEFGQGNDVIEQNVNGQWRKVAIKKTTSLRVTWKMLISMNISQTIQDLFPIIVPIMVQ